jgi:hypothetical protein
MTTQQDHKHHLPHQVVDALTTPAPDVVPHPALDVPTPPRARGEGLDKVVVGVTALLAVAFLVWGFVSTGALADASGPPASPVPGGGVTRWLTGSLTP